MIHSHFVFKSIRIALLAGMLFTGVSAMGHAFEEDGIYYGISSDGTAYVTYRGNAYNEYGYDYSGSVVIPPEVTHDGVTYTVTRIVDRTFYHNAVTDVTLPNTITKIGCCVFEGCYRLQYVNIPNSVTSIDWGTFIDCVNLTSIYIPESVTYIGSYPFRGCTSLEYLYVDEENPVYDSREDCNAIIETATNTIVATCPTSVLPLSVTAIGDYAFTGRADLTEITLTDAITEIGTSAFSGTSLASIDIPNSVTRIGGGAFAGTKLTSLYIPKSVTTINYNPVSGCDDLTSIVVDEQNPNYDSRNNCNAIIKKSGLVLLAGCKTTVIPEVVKELANSAFNGLQGLVSIDIPNRVSVIGPNCFAGCRELKRVHFGTGLQTIGGSAFHTCLSLVDINLENCLGLKTIDTWAFAVCQSLPSVTIPSYVTKVGTNCFNLCYKLRSVTSLAWTPPTAQGDFCFGDSAVILGTLYVPQFAYEDYCNANVWKDFHNIEALPTRFYINDTCYITSSANTCSITYNPSYMSSNVNNYSGDFVIPEKVSFRGFDFDVTAVDNNAFDGSSITSVVIPASVTTIGAEAFQGCTMLKSVIIDKNVNFIGQKAFNYCTALESVTCKGAEPPVMENINCFSNYTYSNAWLVFPWYAYNDYMGTNYWDYFSHRDHYVVPGDADGDGHVNLRDVSYLIDILLGSSGGPYFINGADVDGDGYLTVRDISLIIQLMINN